MAEWITLTDDERQAIVDALPGGLSGYMKGWGWKHFAEAIEARCREKNGACGQPCPFCGHDTPIALDNRGAHYVHCPDCGACGPERFSRREAINAWEKGRRSEPHHQGKENG